MPTRDLIVVGGSAGAVEGSLAMARALPGDLPACICLVIHLPEHAPTVMPQLLRRAGKLGASHPADGDPLVHGHIYVAPPDRHLLIEGEHVRVVSGPRENGHRPAVDPLFRSAALEYGPRTIGVVLSGNLDDGTAGLLAIKGRGGIAIAQDPEEALYDGMPNNAIERAGVDEVLTIDGIVAALVRLTQEVIPDSEEGTAMADELGHDVSIARGDLRAMATAERPGQPTGFTCPECHGALWEIRDGELHRYRCRVGHAYSSETLLSEQERGVEIALWTALRSLEEHAMFCRRLAERSRHGQQRQVADRFERRAEHLQRQATLIRSALESSAPLVVPTAAGR